MAEGFRKIVRHAQMSRLYIVRKHKYKFVNKY